MDTSNPKVAKIETFRNPSLFDIFKAQDDQIVPRKFYGQQTGLAKVQLYPKMGGESDQVDGVRKDGSDALENQAHLDAQVIHNCNWIKVRHVPNWYKIADCAYMIEPK